VAASADGAASRRAAARRATTRLIRCIRALRSVRGR
jgi:hypothetical protein